MVMENFESQKVIYTGGLNSNINHLYLSDYEPGSGIELQNFEAALAGGYRRLSGFEVLTEDSNGVVTPGFAEGRILGVFIFKNEFYCARKQVGGAVYRFFKLIAGVWTVINTSPVAFASTGVTRVKAVTFNFNGTEKIIFVDGVNNATIYDGTNWANILPAASGADFANAGGDQAINAPDQVEVFENHIFVSAGHLVAHSAPLAEYDWTVASGAGQLPAGFTVNRIKTFRDSLVVFGETHIKRIVVNNTDFLVKDLTANIGCVAPGSVVEVNSNLMFLSQDGFRQYAGTDRIDDVALDNTSRKIQNLVLDYIANEDLSALVAVVVRGKSQVRFFFSNDEETQAESKGIILCTRTEAGNVSWEWGTLLGIQASCTTSAYIGSEEYVLHGGYDGIVYRQEQGNKFGDQNVSARFATPYLDFGQTGIRKTMHRIRVFTQPEGVMNVHTKLRYDWANIEKLNPATFDLSIDLGSGSAIYGEAVYGEATYSYFPVPVLLTNVQGSGFSVQITYTTNDDNPPYTLQGALYEFHMEGRK